MNRKGNNGTYPETGRGKGYKFGNSWFYSRLFLVPKKNGKKKVTSRDKSLHLKSVHMTTTFHELVSRYWSRLGCLHRFNGYLSTCSYSFSIKEVPLLHFQQSGLPIQALPFGMSLGPWIVTKLMGVITAHLCQPSISPFPYLEDWLIRDLIHSRLISHTIYCLPNGTKSRIHSKSKKVRFEPSSAIHLST